MQKGMRLNDGHAVYLGLLAKKDGARRGYLSKRSSDNTKWHPKWFALLQNMLFYFESDSSSRPAGLYLLEGCVCDRAPSPKPKDPLEKQVGGGAEWGGDWGSAWGGGWLEEAPGGSVGLPHRQPGAAGGGERGTVPLRWCECRDCLDVSSVGACGKPAPLSSVPPPR